MDPKVVGGVAVLILPIFVLSVQVVSQKIADLRLSVVDGTFSNSTFGHLSWPS